MKGEAKRTGLRLQAVWLAALLAAAPVWSAERADPHLLPPSADYARNPQCAEVRITMPPSDHWEVEGNQASPYPVDMPISQGDSAICYAYATSDMISQRVQAEISALDVATKYYFADPSALGRLTDPALRRHLKRMGDYRRAIEDSRIATEVSRDNNPGRYPYFDKLEGGEEDIAALLYNIGGLCLDSDLPSYDGYTHFTSYLIHLRVWTRLLPPACYSRSSLASVPAALRSARTDAFNEAWINHVEKLCRRIPSPVPLLPVSYRVAANETAFMQLLADGRPPSAAQVAHMFAMIDYALDHGRAPAVGYSWYVLEDRDPKDPDLAADHSSVIIARRKAGSACQYQVQDNTGEYCGFMRREIAARCDLGRIWLYEDELKRTLYSVTYLR